MVRVAHCDGVRFRVRIPWHHPGTQLIVGVFIFLLLVPLCWKGPVHSAVELGVDEHYELNKALLWSRGCPLYDRIWSDQPPLYTSLLGVLFKCFGPTIGIA